MTSKDPSSIASDIIEAKGNVKKEDSQGPSQNSKVTICFCAIFRQEAKNVKRCLDSAMKAIDYICITDTGSTDNTVEIIKRWGSEHNIPTKVIKSKFVNFSVSRTESFTNAKQSFPEATYFLLLDADMILEIAPEFIKNDLTLDYYQLDQKNTHLVYANIRLIRSKLDWKCIGVTHEYWDCKEAKTYSKLKTLQIDDRNDGGFKETKLTRDRDLLSTALDDSDTNAALRLRYLFYLAQTYKDLGKIDKAIKYYTTRIAGGGWEEEVWYCHYMIAKINMDNKNDSTALEWLHKAYNYRPSRLETLVLLSKYYRDKSMHHVSYLYLTMAKSATKPNDSLFLEHTIYEWGIDFELSVVCFYIPGKMEEGKQALLRLLECPSVPDKERGLTINNAKFYNVKV